MREIMFRGKVAEGSHKGEWTQGCVNTHIFTLDALYPVWIQSSDAYLPVVPETVGEFIGLLDKDGRRVFEGDVIKTVTEYDDFYGECTETEIGVVKWLQSFCAYYVEYNARLKDGVTHAILERSEVIGNIYDDPELVPWYAGARERDKQLDDISQFAKQANED